MERPIKLTLLTTTDPLLRRHNHHPLLPRKIQSLRRQIPRLVRANQRHAPIRPLVRPGSRRHGRQPPALQPADRQAHRERVWRAGDVEFEGADGVWETDGEAGGEGVWECGGEGEVFWVGRWRGGVIDGDLRGCM